MFLSALLVDVADWRWLFVLPAALVIAALATTLKALPNSHEHSSHAFDTVGALISVVGLALMAGFAFVDGGYPSILPGILAMGIGMGLAMTAHPRRGTRGFATRSAARSASRGGGVGISRGPGMRPGGIPRVRGFRTRRSCARRLLRRPCRPSG